MSKRRKNTRKSKPALAVVVDGQTEAWYLQMLKRNEQDIAVSIKPEIPNKKSIKEQYKQVCKLSSEEFTKVFWIVDLDTILKEENEKRKRRNSPLKTFNKYRSELTNNYSNVFVIINNPCLEFWLLILNKNTYSKRIRQEKRSIILLYYRAWYVL